MADGIAASVLNALGSICGVHGGVAAGAGGLAGPVLGNVLVAGAAGLVTVFSFAVALKLLISPGERDPSHPKYRILSGDR